MQLIIDSGSTKTRWCLVKNKSIIQELNTAGINPFVTPESVIKGIIDSIVNELQSIPDEIFYYGAGCSNEKNKNLLRVNLLTINSTADVVVEHDMLAVARALCLNKQGIAVILGTGSNSCLYNGREIVQNTPSLGYILGDEGSGAYIGKKILSDYFYQRMPTDIADSFSKNFPDLNLDSVLYKVYKEQSANAYLASFCKWAGNNKTHSYIQELVSQVFEEFVIKQIQPYGRSLTNKVYSVGSIAYYFSEIWESVLLRHGYVNELGKQDPIDGLIEFHAWKN